MQCLSFNVYSLLQLVKTVFLRKTLDPKVPFNPENSMILWSWHFYSVVWKYLKPIESILTIFEEECYGLLNWNER